LSVVVFSLLALFAVSHKHVVALFESNRAPCGCQSAAEMRVLRAIGN